MENFNRVILCGQVITAPAFSHTNHGVSFVRFTLQIPRLSGWNDELTVIVPQEQFAHFSPATGDTVTLVGQLRSFNNKSGEGSRLVISVFARELVAGGDTPINEIQLSGILCKPPTLRRTPLGREICDMILAVNRHYGRADYLPCIAWGAVAQQVAAMHTGDRLTFTGRIQSRTYTKNLGGGHSIQRTAYEVSIMHPSAPEDFSPMDHPFSSSLFPAH